MRSNIEETEKYSYLQFTFINSCCMIFQYINKGIYFLIELGYFYGRFYTVGEFYHIRVCWTAKYEYEIILLSTKVVHSFSRETAWSNFAASSTLTLYSLSKQILTFCVKERTIRKWRLLYTTAIVLDTPGPYFRTCTRCYGVWGKKRYCTVGELCEN